VLSDADAGFGAGKLLKAGTIDEIMLIEAASNCPLSLWGIRSAAFALGLMQGLAQCGLLSKFHYLFGRRLYRRLADGLGHAGRCC
jgi:hypothetical protein